MTCQGDCIRGRRRAVAACAAIVPCAVLGLNAAASAGAGLPEDNPTEVFSNLEAELRVTGMIFVASRGDVSEFVLRARRASFMPDTRIAKLENVRVTVNDEEDRSSFAVSCMRGEFNVDTNDFLAEGDVRGTTGDGRRYTASWVRYDRERDLLYTDAPVTMEDDTGTFRGGGFRYDLKRRTFRLLGNVSLEQAP